MQKLSIFKTTTISVIGLLFSTQFISAQTERFEMGSDSQISADACFSTCDGQGKIVAVPQSESETAEISELLPSAYRVFLGLKKEEVDGATVTGEIATYKDNPDGSVNISLIIEDINEEDQGYYWVVVKNDHGEAKSIKAELDVNDPPKPKDDGVLIPPGDDGQPGDDGSIFFPVPNWSDDDGNPTGDVDATLPGLDDSNALENALVRVCPDSMIMFSVAVVGATPFTFQWQKDGVDIPETNNNILLLKNITDKDEGGYQVVIKNVAGDLASGIVDLEVIDTPVITKHPAGVTVDP